MKRLLLSLCSGCFLLLAAPVPAKAQLYCNQQASVGGFTSTTTVIPQSDNQSIFICGWVISGNGNLTVTFQYGTGANCATITSPVPWGPIIILNSSSLSTLVEATAIFRGLATPPGTSLCMTATAAANATVYYVQQ